MNLTATHRSAFVTGAAGCVGGAMVNKLSQSGFRTVALVRDLARADHLKEIAGVELIVGDLDARERMAEAMRGCDAVFHLAAKVHAPPGTSEAEFARVNVEGTRNVVEAAVEAEVANFVFFSTVAVYPEGGELFDEDSATAPATAYGASKLAAERIVLKSAMKATVLRLPVVYGPRDRGNVARLIDAIRRRRYFIVGDGANLKSMVAVENVVDAALLVANDERARGQIYIVCDERAYTQREIAETIADAIGLNRRFPRLPLSAAMAIGRVADSVGKLTGFDLPISADRIRKLSSNTRCSSAKIGRELGFKPRVTLREGLNEVCFERQSFSSRASSPI
ncbi:MAG: Aurachin B dehydrogenase [Acidobacteria bacterium]|nr:Aurachin B dehydrogenase [Acidobacteriota bacterium]